MLESLENLGIVKLHLGFILEVESKHDCNLSHLSLIRSSRAAILNM